MLVYELIISGKKRFLIVGNRTSTDAAVLRSLSALQELSRPTDFMTYRWLVFSSHHVLKFAGRSFGINFYWKLFLWRGIQVHLLSKCDFIRINIHCDCSTNTVEL